MGVQLTSYVAQVWFAALLNLTVLHHPWYGTHVEDESNEARDAALGFGEWEVSREQWKACPDDSPVRQNIHQSSRDLLAKAVENAGELIPGIMHEFITQMHGMPMSRDAWMRLAHTPSKEEGINVSSSAALDRLLLSRAEPARELPRKGITFTFRETAQLESQFHRNATLVRCSHSKSRTDGQARGGALIHISCCCFAARRSLRFAGGCSAWLASSGTRATATCCTRTPARHSSWYQPSR